LICEFVFSMVSKYPYILIDLFILRVVFLVVMKYLYVFNNKENLFTIFKNYELSDI
jgi:hypothetical protein